MNSKQQRPSFGIYDNLESYMVGTMIIMSLLTYPLAIFSGHTLYLSDYIGISGLMVVLMVSKINKELTFYFLFVLLFIGMLNLASFVYYFNFVIKFGVFGQALTPGIQFYSFILFFVLVVFRRPRIISIYQKLVGDTEEGRKKHFAQQADYYRKRFERLTDSEIRDKLAKDISPEAVEALHDILKERSQIKARTENSKS